MALPPNYWNLLAADYVTANDLGWGNRALLLAMAVAEHETNNGRAWPGSFNFGAVQLRGLTPAEWAKWNADPKQLNPGDKYPGNPGGVLHVDTHPTPSGPVPYPVWFAAFPTQVDGVRYFLHTLNRLTGGAANDPAADAVSTATAMYVHGYFEGAHAGGRPLGKRVAPFNPGEQANINDYANAIVRCLHGIVGNLDITTWAAFNPLVPPPSPGSVPDPGQEAGEVGADESDADSGLPGNAHDDVKSV